MSRTTRSPILSPRPNPPATRQAPTPAKAKALAVLTASHSQPISATSTPGDGGVDLAEQMNDEIRQQFVQGQRLGEGTYAVVYTGHYRHSPTSLVAIKKMKVITEYKDGISMDSLREIKYMSELSHPNIVKLHAVFSTKEQNLSLVLEHLPLGDLEAMWKDHTISYTGADIKAWSNMLAQAVWFCHENWILHRDIKGNNLLIAADGTVKLADFGLARSFADPGRPMTYNVITRFYRPPELLYGARYYSGKVDIWSMGVVIAELALRDFFLPSETDMGQIDVIHNVFGTPTEDTWPGVSKLDFYHAPTPATAKKPQVQAWWRNRLPLLGEDGIELVRAMLAMDPKKRLNARQVLEHRYWTNAPRPTKTTKLPRKGGGEKKMADDLKRRPGEVSSMEDGVGSGRADKVARKLDFSKMK